MLLKPQLLFVLLFFTGPLAWCQNISSRRALSITLSPALIPITASTLTLQPGLQLRANRWGLLAQVTAPLSKPHNTFNVRYLRTGLELKRYFKPQHQVQVYLSAEATYAWRQFDNTDSGSFFRRDGSDRYSYTSASIHTPLRTLTPKAGFELRMGKRGLFDGFFGIGVRTIYTSYSNVENEVKHSEPLIGHIGPISAYRYDKTITRLHVTSGFRFGYALAP